MSMSGDLDATRKNWATTVAKGALRGYQLWRSDAGDGEQRFFIARWGMCRVLASLNDVDQFLERAGVTA